MARRFYLDCENCGKPVGVSFERKIQKEFMVCRECRRYVDIPVEENREIGHGFMPSLIRRKSKRYGKNGRPRPRSSVKPIAIKIFRP